MALRLTPEKIAELRAKAAALRAARDLNSSEPVNNVSRQINGIINGSTARAHDSLVPTEHNSNGTVSSGIVNSSADSKPISSPAIQYNEQQLKAIKLAIEGKSFVLTGAAGTGKTFTTKGCIASIVQSNKHLPLSADGHKHLSSGSPGIVCCAYTRRAVQNIRKVMPADIASNCITIHKLLEYGPVYYEVTDEETGDTRKTMRFEPARNQFNPLPDSIHTIIIDEASMVSVELFELLCLALAHPVVFIFIGDIQQLPPVFGSAILGYKLLSLPVVELTHVYRQALESPIIKLAHRILSGVPVPCEEYNDWYDHGKLKIHPWKKRLSADVACATACKFLTSAIDSGIYDPDLDIVLCPFNKSFGTIELNNAIANFLGLKRGAIVYEVICGFQKKYLAVGDRILFDKEDAVITAIKYNSIYGGAMPQAESATLDRWGHQQGEDHEIRNQSADEIDAMLDAMISGGDDETEGRKKSCSHEITIQFCATGEERTVSTVGEVSTIDLGYALTVHKSQGSEWRRVFFLTHNSHATMLQRELIYTACTRAREELYWICEPDTLTKAVLNQRIKGNTIEEKAEWFKGVIDRKELQSSLALK